MKAIICEQPGQFKNIQKSPPRPKPGEALLQIQAIGICGTDLHAYQGNQAFFSYPRILGHELSARVVEISAADGHTIQEGDQVAILPYLNCGKCVACRIGKTNCCQHLQVLGVHIDGGMQEYLSLPSEFLVPANHLSSGACAVVEPLAIAAHAIERANLLEEEWVVVMGVGPIGLAIVKQAELKGAKVICIDKRADRLEQAQQFFGAEHGLLLGSDSVKEQVSKITNGDMAHVVFDASGNQKALESGPEYMAHGGRYILVGLFKGDLTYHHPSIHAKEISLLSSRNATLKDFEAVIQMLGKGAFPVERYLSQDCPFDEMIARFDSWVDGSGGLIKAMVYF